MWKGLEGDGVRYAIQGSELSFSSLSYCARSSSHNTPLVTDVDSGQYHCRQGDKVRQYTNYTAGAGYKPQVM
jgi:hypothetical protein